MFFTNKWSKELWKFKFKKTFTLGFYNSYENNKLSPVWKLFIENNWH